MCGELESRDKVSSRIGIVTFDKTAHDLTNGLVSVAEAKKAIGEIKPSSDTNMMAGLMAGKAMLDQGTADDKYLVLLSDGIPIYWVNDQGEATGKMLSKYTQLDENGNPDYVFEGIKGSPTEFCYRNKMEFSFGDAEKDGPLTLGLHKKGSTYDVLTASDCKLVHEDLTKILTCVLDYCKEQGFTYYHKMRHEGYLRHLLMRRGNTTGEILINLVTTTQLNPDLSELVERLMALSLEGKIVGILHILNDSLADLVQSDETRVLYGQDYFYENLLGLKFKITPFSFFQPNSLGAEVLYETARSYIGDTRDMTVFDLYSGTGTISQILAAVAKKVIGV